MYLSLLVEDLRILWNEGFNKYNNQNFKMCDMLFCIINDFPTYRNLSMYSVKRHKACLICEEDISYRLLTHGRKTCYLGHRKFLKTNHAYDQLKKNDVAPRALNEVKVFERVKNKCFLQQGIEKGIEKIIWIKEKNICDNVIETLLNVQEKTKDDMNTRLVLIDMVNISAPSISNYVNENTRVNAKLKISWLKSYDCHVLMQQLLLVAICDVLPKNVRKVLTRLYLFFYAICNKKHLLLKEAIEFYTNYMYAIESVGILKFCHEGRLGGKCIRDVTVKSMCWEEVLQELLSSTLLICSPKHFEEEKPSNERKIYHQIWQYSCGKSMHFSTSKDKNLIMTFICYFGEVDYTKFRVFVFKCKWVDSNTGVQTDELGFTFIDLDKVGYKGEPFIMASHAK
ncbi:hypothetical protein CR513_14919, partial [Mucuna pruriens]